MLSATTGSVDSNFLARARGFLVTAEKLANDPEAFAPAVRLLILQASELALKALSAVHNIKRGHDLKELMDHLKANNAVDGIAWAMLQDQVLTLTSPENYNVLRYPKDNFLFWERMIPQETKILLNAGRTIVEICQVQIDARSKAAKTS